MPKIVCDLRDSLYILNKFVLKSEKEELKHCQKGHALWIKYPEIKNYLKVKSKYVTLTSKTKLIAESHYRSNHPKNNNELFLPMNGYNVFLANTDLILINLKDEEY